MFEQKQAELEMQHESYEDQLALNQERLRMLDQAADRKKIVEEILADLGRLGGVANLPFDMQRRLFTQLVEEITLDTQEQWFEIRGELTDRFSYADGQIVSTSA